MTDSPNNLSTMRAPLVQRVQALQELASKAKPWKRARIVADLQRAQRNLELHDRFYPKPTQTPTNPETTRREEIRRGLTPPGE